MPSSTWSQKKLSVQRFELDKTNSLRPFWKFLNLALVAGTTDSIWVELEIYEFENIKLAESIYGQIINVFSHRIKLD